MRLIEQALVIGSLLAVCLGISGFVAGLLFIIVKAKWWPVKIRDEFRWPTGEDYVAVNAVLIDKKYRLAWVIVVCGFLTGVLGLSVLGIAQIFLGRPFQL